MRVASSSWARAVWCVLFLAVFTAPVAAAALFPEPLHLRREVHDPISGSTATIDEYCSGSRIVTVQGARVVIADYESGVLTEIDRNAATFSITSFADVARAASTVPRREEAAEKSQPEPRRLAPKQAFDGASLEAFEFTRTSEGAQTTIEVAVDRRFEVSAAAVEALIGAAFPNRRTFAHDAMLRAAAPPAAGGRRIQTDSAASFGLPAEQTVTYAMGDEHVVFRATVVAADRALVPADLLTIPPGATRVESRLVSVPRMLHEIDNLRPQQP